MAINRDLEGVFLDLGQDLEQLSTLSDQIVSTGETLLRLAAGQADGDDFLRRAIDVLQRPVSVLDESLNRSSEVVIHLRRHQEMIGEVRRLESLLDRIVAPLRFIQTAFRIESAALDPEVRTIFVALTRDIEQLHGQVMGLFAEQFQSLRRAHEEIGALAVKLAPQIDRHRKLAQEKKVAIERALEELRLALEENQSRDIRLVDAAQGLRHAVGEVVGALQCQDIIAQKLSHVDEAVVEMGQRLDQLPSRRTGGGEVAWAEVCAFLNGAGQVQVGQIRSVQAELDQSEATIQGALEELVTRSNSVDQECLSLQNFRTISIEGDGVVQVVLNSIEDLAHVIDLTHAMQTEVYETLRPLGNMASNLTGVIRGLSQNIRLIALNAQIQAAHVGAGTGLEVLSQRTRQIADEAADANNRSAAALERLIAGFDGLVAECRELQDTVGEQKRWITEEGGSVRRSLHDYRDRTLATFINLGSIVEATRGRTRGAQQKLAFEAAACARLDELVAAVESFVDLTTEEMAGAAVPVAAAAELNRKYTMASEREIHASILQRQPAAAESAPAPEGDIELFPGDPPPPVAEAVAMSSEVPAGPAADGEAKAEAAADPADVPANKLPAAPAPAPAAGVALGDNVELF